MLMSKLCAKALIDLVDHDQGGLRMHGGICWGEIYFLRVGSEVKGPGHAMYMIAGKCVEGAGDSLEETTNGQVQVHNTKEIITADTEIDRSEGESMLLGEGASSLGPAIYSRLEKLTLAHSLTTRSPQSSRTPSIRKLLTSRRWLRTTFCSRIEQSPTSRRFATRGSPTRSIATSQ